MIGDLYLLCNYNLDGGCHLYTSISAGAEFIN